MKALQIPTIRFPEFNETKYTLYKTTDFLTRHITPVKLEEGVHYTEIGIRSWGKGIFHKPLVTSQDIGGKRVFWLDKNLFILNIVFAWEQAVAATSEYEVGKIASHRFPMFKAATDKANLQYIVYKFLTDRGKQLLELASPGGAGRNKTLGQKEFDRLRLYLPCPKEQQKISDFLTAVDSKISQLTEKHRLLNEYKKGAMQQLFSQQLRFKDKDGNAFPEWEEKPLFKMLTEYKCKTTIENQYDVLTSSRSGLMMQSDYYGEGRLTERSNVGFHVIPHDYITYRSRSDDRMFFFNLNERGKTGIISHYYPVFSMNNGQNHFFIELTRYHSKIFGKYAVGTSQVVLSYNSLSEIKLKFPCTQEQQKIAQFLQSIDKKITAVVDQIEQTKQFKKGLLQQMFV